MLLKKLEAITTERDALVSRVAVIQKEREALIVQLEQEEEYLTNTLQKKLTTVRTRSYRSFLLLPVTNIGKKDAAQCVLALSISN